MGYRTYIGSMPKSEYNKIKSMTSEQLIAHYKIEVGDFFDGDNYWHKGVYDYGKELYEFGKYVDFDPPKKSSKPFFKKKELMARYDEYDFQIVTPEFLEYVIESYRKRILTYYNDMITPFFGKKDGIMVREEPTNFLNSIKIIYNYPDNKYQFDFNKITDDEQTALFKVLEHVRSFRNEWSLLTPFNLKNGEAITTSWKYEYGIFELVRIYKTFDWKKNVMIYYGY